MLTIADSQEDIGFTVSKFSVGLSGGLVVKNLPRRGHEFSLWVETISWSRKWQPTPVFLPGKSPGQRSLVGSSPWGREESDVTEAT